MTSFAFNTMIGQVTDLAIANVGVSYPAVSFSRAVPSRLKDL